MKRFVAVVVLSLAGGMLTGCMSVTQHPGFRDAGSLPDRKATILLGPEWTSVWIDDQKVSLGLFPWSITVVEILPGRHEVKVVWSKTTTMLSGSFMAENGRNYAILSDTSTETLSSGYRPYAYRIMLHRVYISVLPVGKSHELSFVERLTAYRVENKGYRKVADLRLSK